jgi:hypothetical protein
VEVARANRAPRVGEELRATRLIGTSSEDAGYVGMTLQLVWDKEEH